MKVGDLVRVKSPGHLRGGWCGIVTSEVRHGINASYVDVLVEGEIISVRLKVVEVIGESR